MLPFISRKVDLSLSECGIMVILLGITTIGFQKMNAITVAPLSVQVLAGRGTSFHCYGEAEEQLNWIGSAGELIENGAGITVEEYVGSYKVVSLRFLSVTKDNEGIYCCSLLSSSCSEGKNVTLVVILPSTRFIAPSIQYVSAADHGESNVFITCSIAAGDPPPTIVWYLSGVGFLDISERGNKYQANYSGLVIHDFTEDDVGNYTCEYQQNLSGSFSTVIEVRLVENIIVGPRELLVGSNDVLQCIHDNNLPVLRTIWIRPNGSANYGPELQISNVQIEEEGLYRCILQLSNGSQIESVEFEHKLVVYGELLCIHAHSKTILVYYIYTACLINNSFKLMIML